MTLCLLTLYADDVMVLLDLSGLLNFHRILSAFIDNRYSSVCSVQDRLGLLVPCSSISPKMASARSIRLTAVSNVLGRLGEAMLVVLKHHLKRYYSLSLDGEDDSFTVDELHDALAKLLGESAAGILTDEIHKEIERLSTEQLH